MICMASNRSLDVEILPVWLDTTLEIVYLFLWLCISGIDPLRLKLITAGRVVEDSQTLLQQNINFKVRAKSPSNDLFWVVTLQKSKKNQGSQDCYDISRHYFVWNILTHFLFVQGRTVDGNMFKWNRGRVPETSRWTGPCRKNTSCCGAALF